MFLSRDKTPHCKYLAAEPCIWSARPGLSASFSVKINTGHLPSLRLSPLIATKIIQKRSKLDLTFCLHQFTPISLISGRERCQWVRVLLSRSLCFRRSSWCSSACCWRWSCLATPWCSSRSSRPGPGGQGWISSLCTWPWPTSAWGCSPCPRTSCGRWPWPGRPGCWPASSSGSYRWSSPMHRPMSWWRSASTDMTPSPTPWPSLAAVSVGLSLIPLTSHPTASSARLDSDDQQLAQMAQSREKQSLSVLLLTRLEDKWDWYLNFREAGQVVGSQCLVSLHPVLCADHLPLQHRGAGDGARAGCPVLDQLPWAVALEALHDAGVHQPLLHPRRHHRHLLRRHRGHHLAEGADHGHSESYPVSVTPRYVTPDPRPQTEICLMINIWMGHVRIVKRWGVASKKVPSRDENV